ncbi:hypothetical protein E2C01_020509 [Portunus trituberculatus]|uniref:Uncharacterized protein n=1 Tax=Portunus trituberculatus TaxID=210409 RepID=A0A5B7E026_PORTR|nr:hypothetical protein [Portunus trituberculatus]
MFLNETRLTSLPFSLSSPNTHLKLVAKSQNIEQQGRQKVWPHGSTSGVLMLCSYSSVHTSQLMASRNPPEATVNEGHKQPEFLRPYSPMLRFYIVTQATYMCVFLAHTNCYGAPTASVNSFTVLCRHQDLTPVLRRPGQVELYSSLQYPHLQIGNKPWRRNKAILGFTCLSKLRHDSALPFPSSLLEDLREPSGAKDNINNSSSSTSSMSKDHRVLSSFAAQGTVKSPSLHRKECLA